MRLLQCSAASPLLLKHRACLGADGEGDEKLGPPGRGRAPGLQSGPPLSVARNRQLSLFPFKGPDPVPETAGM